MNRSRQEKAATLRERMGRLEPAVGDLREHEPLDGAAVEGAVVPAPNESLLVEEVRVSDNGQARADPFGDRIPDLRRAPRPEGWWARAVKLRPTSAAARLEGQNDRRVAEAVGALEGFHTVVMISPKGGVGKTTLSLVLSLLLSTYEGTRVITTEVQPDYGTLSKILPDPRSETIRDLLAGLEAAERGGVSRLEAHMTKVGRLPVLTAPNDHEDLAPEHYQRVLDALSRFYGVAILDCGTDLTQPLNRWALSVASHVCLVSTPDQPTMELVWDAARDLVRARAERLLASGGHLSEAKAYAKAQRDHTLVMNMSAGAQDPIDPGKVREAMAGLSDVLYIPHSPVVGALAANRQLSAGVLSKPFARASKAALASLMGRLREAQRESWAGR